MNGASRWLDPSAGPAHAANTAAASTGTAPLPLRRLRLPELMGDLLRPRSSGGGRHPSVVPAGDRPRARALRAPWRRANRASLYGGFHRLDAGDARASSRSPRAARATTAGRMNAVAPTVAAGTPYPSSRAAAPGR